MYRITPTASAFGCAAILIASSLALGGCETGESLVRQDPLELTECGGVSAGQRDWETQRNWQQGTPGSDSCKSRKTQRCEIQTSGHVIRYRCE